MKEVRWAVQNKVPVHWLQLKWGRNDSIFFSLTLFLLKKELTHVVRGLGIISND